MRPLRTGKARMSATHPSTCCATTARGAALRAATMSGSEPGPSRRRTAVRLNLGPVVERTTRMMPVWGGFAQLLDGDWLETWLRAWDVAPERPAELDPASANARTQSHEQAARHGCRPSGGRAKTTAKSPARRYAR